MKVTLVSGFLGAGKTTLIRRIVQGADSRLAVVVNDFGDVGIDSELVSSAGNIKVAELASGCVCCTLRAELGEVLKELGERFSPERVLLEASGVATTSGIVGALRGLERRGVAELYGVVNVIDASSFPELYAMGSFRRLCRDAIANASVVVISKVDLAGEREVEYVERVVGEINPSALVLRSSFGEVLLPERLPCSEVDAGEEVHLLLDSFSAKPGEMNAEKAEELFERLRRGEFGRIVRAKGIFRYGGRCRYFDLSSGRVSSEELAGEAEPGFVAIGREIDVDSLRAFLEAQNEHQR
ncbi:MAG: GTP-binding protein [Euryarchaeota archaeon]|nr:GTP-binding protein [Euryarchaeota archaeon]